MSGPGKSGSRGPGVQRFERANGGGEHGVGGWGAAAWALPQHCEVEAREVVRGDEERLRAAGPRRPPGPPPPPVRRSRPGDAAEVDVVASHHERLPEGLEEESYRRDRETELAVPPCVRRQLAARVRGAAETPSWPCSARYRPRARTRARATPLPPSARAASEAPSRLVVVAPVARRDVTPFEDGGGDVDGVAGGAPTRGGKEAGEWRPSAEADGGYPDPFGEL